jgi:hypothetical protein
MPRYNWNIVESNIKLHKSNQSIYTRVNIVSNSIDLNIFQVDLTVLYKKKVIYLKIVVPHNFKWVRVNN